MCLKLFVFVCISINSIVFDLINYELLVNKLTNYYHVCNYRTLYICGMVYFVYFGENMNQFQMEKLMRANMGICGKICTKTAGNDTKSSLKCHGNILFYTLTRHRNTSKYRVNTTSMKRREVTSLNDVSYRSDVKVSNKAVVAKTLLFLQTS